MKTIIKVILPVFLIAGLFLVSSCGSTAENNNETVEEISEEKSSDALTESFKVFGNCTMCKERIEKAALAVAGVSEASWSTETKMIELVLDKSKTDAHKVQIAIASVGHDTEMHKAKDDIYNALPDCCQYDRTGMTSNEHEHNHEH